MVNITFNSGHFIPLSSVLLTSVANEFTIPNAILVNLYCTSGVTKAVLCTSSGATGICQYPLVRSFFDKYFLPLSLMNRSFSVVIGSGSTLVILFNFRKSMHTVLKPSSFFKMTISDAYCYVDGLTTHISSISTIVFVLQFFSNGI